jgi:hypothetical protein
MKVLVANPPWPGPGYGARSDVRWPHKRIDKYIEYPIYLSYTVAVIEKAGFEVSFIDAIMDELSIEEFAGRVHDIAPALAASTLTWRQQQPSRASRPGRLWHS